MNEQNKSPFKKNGMFNEANPLVFALAKNLRKNMTASEMILWGYLKTKPGGFKFRRQHPLGLYIADFYCHKLYVNESIMPDALYRLFPIEDSAICNKCTRDSIKARQIGSRINSTFKIVRTL